MYITRLFLLSTVLTSLLACSSSSSSATRAKDATTPDVAPAPTDHVPGGGGCAYNEIPGTCKITSADLMTFTGKLDGKDLVLTDNHLTTPGTVGSSVACTLNLETKGTCTPCTTSLGECGQEAWAVSNTHSTH